jgi:hypothetical protein
MVIGGVELCCTSDPDICDSSGILPVMKNEGTTPRQVVFVIVSQ